MNLKKSIPVIVIAAIALALVFILPWRMVSWGKIEFVPSETITVSGEANRDVKTQVATFTAGVSSVNDDKDAAVREVNQTVDQLIQAVKTFGIAQSDIKTQNLNIYQMEEQYYEEGRQKTRKGQWRVGNDIEITLRNVDQASDLANLLSQSGATNVWGPNFSLDDTAEAEAGLLTEAIDNARKKAEIIATGSSRRLGKILTVSEGMSQQNGPFLGAMMDGRGGGGGAAIEPGSGRVTQSVTVTFELK